MSALEVVKALEGVGVRLVLEGGRLTFKASKGAFTADRRRLVERHRDAIVALLAAPVAVDKTRPTDLRAHLWASLGEDSLVERYGATLAGELLDLVQRHEKFGALELRQKYWALWLDAEAKPRPVAATATPAAAKQERKRGRPERRKRPWSKLMRELTSWCLKLQANELPAAPFELWPGNWVVDEVRFLTELKKDVSLGPEHPRARHGGLERDLAALREVVRKLEESF